MTVDGAQVEDTSQAAPPVVGRRWGRAGLVGGLVAAVAIAAAVVVTSSGAGPVPSAAAAAAVQRAAISTLERKAVAVDFQGDESVAGMSVAITGRGVCVLDPEACRLTASLPSMASVGQVEEVEVGGTLYLKLPASEAAAAHLATPWLSEPLPMEASSSTENPLQGLVLLGHSGAKVTDLGATTFSGRRANQYLVDYSAAALRERLSGELSSLPSAERAAIAEAASAFSNGLQYHAYLTPSGRLLGMSFALSVTLKGVAVSIQFTMEVSAAHGTARITAPPASEVSPLSSLGAGL